MPWGLGPGFSEAVNLCKVFGFQYAWQGVETVFARVVVDAWASAYILLGPALPSDRRAFGVDPKP